MPIYEYTCKSCGAGFEEIVFGDQEVACKSCQGRDVEKRFSAFAVGHSSTASAAPAPEGPCGSCGAAQRGMCQMN